MVWSMAAGRKAAGRQVCDAGASADGLHLDPQA